MYQYDDYDRALVFERVAQFRDQVERFMAGELSEEEFLPLRLQNGLYLQKHAYMLRVAIPYGTLSARQMRALAHIAREYDRGYGHFTTRQNIQFNWIDLERVGDILGWLAEHDMHAIQTSGNCVRNITTEAFAGVAADEYLDPRPLAEILRQWSTVNPEFLYLPRKFKIALCAAEQDRAAIQVHDIGLHLKKNQSGELGFAVYVGGGQGRTPLIAKKIRDFLPEEDLLTYITAIVRVYNLHGRRDNKYKARIKILVKALTPEVFAQRVDAEWAHLKDGPSTLTDAEVARVAAHFIDPAYKALSDQDAALAALDAWPRVHAACACVKGGRGTMRPLPCRCPIAPTMNRTTLPVALIQEKNHGDADANLSVIEARVAEAAKRHLVTLKALATSELALGDPPVSDGANAVVLTTVAVVGVGVVPAVPLHDVVQAGNCDIKFFDVRA